MRPIDADALKDFIDGCGICAICPQRAPRCSYDCDFPDFVTEKWNVAIDAQPTIDAVSEWIPCEERLPKEEGRFLVTVQKEAWDRKYSDIEIAYCSPNHKWFNIANCDVLAWMPLPQPYKETDHE